MKRNRKEGKKKEGKKRSEDEEGGGTQLAQILKAMEGEGFEGMGREGDVLCRK